MGLLIVLGHYKKRFASVFLDSDRDPSKVCPIFTSSQRRNRFCVKFSQNLHQSGNPQIKNEKIGKMCPTFPILSNFALNSAKFRADFTSAPILSRIWGTVGVLAKPLDPGYLSAQNII